MTETTCQSDRTAKPKRFGFLTLAPLLIAVFALGMAGEHALGAMQKKAQENNRFAWRLYSADGEALTRCEGRRWTRAFFAGYAEPEDLPEFCAKEEVEELLAKEYLAGRLGRLESLLVVSGLVDLPLAGSSDPTLPLSTEMRVRVMAYRTQHP